MCAGAHADLWHRRPAMLAKIYVQRDPASGEFIHKNVYNAWYGFTRMGVWAAVAAYTDAPAAYVIDFGVLADGSAALVAVNDGFSFACHGLDPYAHARMLTARWLELVGLADA